MRAFSVAGYLISVFMGCTVGKKSLSKARIPRIILWIKVDTPYSNSLGMSLAQYCWKMVNNRDKEFTRRNWMGVIRKVFFCRSVFFNQYGASRYFCSRLMVFGILFTLFALVGCKTTSKYRKEADRVGETIIEKKQEQLFHRDTCRMNRHQCLQRCMQGCNSRPVGWDVYLLCGTEFHL